MGAVITNPQLFAANGELRTHARQGRFSLRALRAGCEVCASELLAGRTKEVAICCGLKAMRQAQDEAPRPVTAA